MARRKREKAGGGPGEDSCFCGVCECETRKECLDPHTDCRCKGRPDHCCQGPSAPDPEKVFEVIEQERPILVPA